MSEADQPGARRPWWARRTLSRRLARALSLLGIALITLSITGWWLATRVLDDDGFGDVVAKASQQPAVREYIANQATLRLAKTNNFVAAARPVVTTALAEAIDQPAVTKAIHAFAKGAHHQIFRINEARRVNIAAGQASVTIRAALETIDPALSAKLPASVLSSSATIAQNPTVDWLARASVWIRWLYLPVGIIGVLLLGFVFARAEDPVHAVRFTGLTLAVAGAFPIGLGLITPLFAAAGGTGDPGRGAAVAAFVKVLLGRLVGSGWVLVAIGALLAFAPGRDNAGLRARAARLGAWLARVRTERPWQIAGAAVLIGLAAVLLAYPGPLLRWVAVAVAVLAAFAGMIVALRALGVLAGGTRNRPLRTRQVGGVAAAMVVCVAGMTAVTSGVVASASHTTRANPKESGCNGYVELCLEPLNQIVWPASHNAMSSTAYNFFSAEHSLSITEQLNAGIKVLLLDAYYGYKQDGIVRTNLAGGASAQDLQAKFGKAGVEELNRLGALTGTVDTSGKKKDVYFCHDYCELGAVKAVDVFTEIRKYLDRNPTDVLMLDFEDYVQPADLRKAMVKAGLFDRVYTVDPHKPLPTLLDMVDPPKGQDSAQRRLITVAERHGNQESWLPATYSLMQETPYTFLSPDQFNCKPNRGNAANPMLLVNHWIRPNGPPAPSTAKKVNSLQTLTDRMEQCIDDRGMLPNILAVDFPELGDLTKVVNNFNAAVAEATGTRAFWDQAIQDERNDTSLTNEERAGADSLARLPFVTDQQARGLLGPLYGKLTIPDLVALEQEVNALPDPGGH